MKRVLFALNGALLIGAALIATDRQALYAQGCTFTLSRANVLAGPEGPIFGFADITASASNCTWTAQSSASWLTVGGAGSINGVGSSRIGYGLAPNTTGATRTATITAGGQVINVTQQITACVTSLTPSSLSFPYPGFGNPADQRKPVTIDAPADCHWQHSPWPIFLSPNPTFGGIGPATVNVGIITILPGGSSTINVGIGSLPLTLTRLDPPCVFTLTPSQATVSVNGGSGTVAVTGTGSDCSFTPFSSGTGFSITSVSAASAPATISYTMTANPGTFQRDGTIAVQNATATITQNGPPVRLDVFSLAFGVISSGGTVTHSSVPDRISLTIDEQPGSAWTATVSQPWLTVTPSSGTGPAVLSVGIDPAAVPPPSIADTDIRVAEIAFTAAFAPPTAVRRMLVSLNIKRPAIAAAPTGVFETPQNGAINLSGAVPVTGWAVDDIAVSRIQIYRDPVAGEGASEIYIGDAIRVRGARPDVAAFRSDLPDRFRAGWGYMLLSNVLPGSGNGTFTFSAYVDDVDGHRTLLGRRTVTFNNAGAVRPFGTIDEPAQGQTVSGTTLNRGWVLTPSGKSIPFDGSTIRVYIDGVLLSPVSQYNIARPDVKAFFPGLANSDGPEARLSIDTRTLSDGVHTIAWGVVDDAGVAEGIGSRYFTVQNGATSLVFAPPAEARSAAPLASMPMLTTDVWSREGLDDTGWATRVETDADGRRTLFVARGQRVELFLDPTLAAPCGRYDGHLLQGDVAATLPAGASLDAERGIFRWQTGAETRGDFAFVFVQRGCDGVERRVPVRVVVSKQGDE